jgi:hypothetical protein
MILRRLNNMPPKIAALSGVVWMIVTDFLKAEGLLK